MKKVLLTLLAVLLVLEVFAAVGYTGYRFGYAQGVRTAANGDIVRLGLRLFDGFERPSIPNFGDRFERRSDRDFRSAGFPMRGIGFFAPLRFLLQIAVLGLVIWFAYWLFARSGWRLTRTMQTIETQQNPAETGVREEKQDPEN